MDSRTSGPCVAKFSTCRLRASPTSLLSSLEEIQNQVRWTTQQPQTAGSIEQGRVDALQLLRQNPPITELSLLDPQGKEFLKVSRLAMDVVGSGTDYSKEPKFTEAIARKIYYGPVYIIPKVGAVHDFGTGQWAARRRREHHET